MDHDSDRFDLHSSGSSRMRSRTELVIRGILAFAFLVWITSLPDEAWSWLGPLFFLRFDVAVFIGAVGGGFILILPLPWQLDSAVQDDASSESSDADEPPPIRPAFRGLAYVLGPLMIIMGALGAISAVAQVLSGEWVTRHDGQFAFYAVGSIVLGVVFLRAGITGQDSLS